MAIDAAQRVSAALTDVGLSPGSTLLLVGTNPLQYTVFWFAAQISGLQTILINPEYPADLITGLIGEVGAAAVASESGSIAAGDGHQIDYSAVLSGAVSVDGVLRTGDRRGDWGTDRDPLDIATLMYTSGTSGKPKLCAQSHRYLLEIGQYVADTFCLSPADVVYAPLPLFHINPLGYGLMGALCGLSDFATSPRFSASRFWATVAEHHATVLILHGPPVQILLKNPALTGTHGAGLILRQRGTPDSFPYPTRGHGLWFHRVRWIDPHQVAASRRTAEHSGGHDRAAGRWWTRPPPTTDGSAPVTLAGPKAMNWCSSSGWANRSG